MGFFFRRRERKLQNLFAQCCIAEGAEAVHLRSKIAYFGPRGWDVWDELMERALDPSRPASFFNACLILAERVDYLDEEDRALSILEKAAQSVQLRVREKECLFAAFAIVLERFLMFVAWADKTVREINQTMQQQGESYAPRDLISCMDQFRKQSVGTVRRVDAALAKMASQRPTMPRWAERKENTRWKLELFVAHKEGWRILWRQFEAMLSRIEKCLDRLERGP